MDGRWPLSRATDVASAAECTRPPPRLRDLTLGGCLPNLTQLSQDSSISLAELEHPQVLRLTGTTTQCRQLLDTLIFPPTCSLFFDVLSAPNEGPVTSYIADFLRRDRTLTPLQACCMLFARDSSATFEGWHELPDPLHSSTASSYKRTLWRTTLPRPDIELRARCHGNLPEPHDLFYAFPMQNIRVVAFKLGYHLEPTLRWEKMVNDWLTVEHLVVELSYIASLLHIFAYTPHTPSPLLGPRRIVSVRLWDDAFARKYDLPLRGHGQSEEKFWEDHLKSLHAALQHRMRPGVLGWNIEEIILD